MFSLARAWRLTRVMLKAGMNWETRRKGQNAAKKSLLKERYKILLTLALLIFVMVSIGTMAYGMAPVFIASGQEMAYFQMLTMLVGFILIFYGFFYTVNGIAYGTGQERLLSLPLTMGEILFSRLAALLLWLNPLALLFAVPFCFVYGYLLHAPWDYYLRALLASASLILLPLGWLTVLTILLMRFTPFFRNKSRFLMISQMLIMVVTMGISLYPSFQKGLQDASSEGMEMSPSFTTAMAGIAQKYPLALRLGDLLFPNQSFLRRAMEETAPSAWLDLLSGMLIGVAGLALALLIGERLYQPGAMAGSRAKRKLLSVSSLDKALRPRPVFATLFSRERKLVLRNPVLVTNAVTGPWLMIFFLVALTVWQLISHQNSGDLPSLDMLREMLAGVQTEPEMRHAVWTFSSLGLALFVHGLMGSMSLNATAISREGSALSRLKMLPLKPALWIWVKTLLSILLTGLPLLLLLLAAILILQIPVMLFIIPLLAYLLTTVLTHLLALMIDVLLPNLNWASEEGLVKRGKGVVLAMLANYAMAAFCGILLYLAATERISMLAALGAFFALELPLTVLFSVDAPRRLAQLLDRLE